MFVLLIILNTAAIGQDESVEKLVPHHVEAGAHDYAPGHGFSLSRKVIGFDFTFCLPESAWFDPSENGPLQRDGKDWNKAGGVSYFSIWRPVTYPKNHSSALVAMRPGPRKGSFQICAYTNEADGSWETGTELAINAGDTVHVSARIDGDRLTYVFTTPYETEVTQHLLNPLTYAVPVGPWFGGNRESPVEHTVYTRLILIQE